MTIYILLLSLDAPLPWDTGFSDSASFNVDGIHVLHDIIMFFLVSILIGVTWIMCRTISYFSTAPNNVKRSLVDVHSTHGKSIELIWTLTPAIILLFISLPSFRLLYLMDEIIDPVITVKAIGRQWYWTYEYSDYLPKYPANYDSYVVAESDLTPGSLRLLEVDTPLLLPIDTHIRLITTASDVIHSIGVPALGLKADAIPGRLNQVSLYIKRSATYYGQCSELCGVGHAAMPIVIQATSHDSYLDWLRNTTFRHLMQDALHETY